MALDPKQVLQRNIPLVVCYVAAIVPIVLWFVFVSAGVYGGPKNSYKSVATQLSQRKKALETIGKDIDKDKSQVYTPDHAKKFKERDAEIEAQVGNITKLLESRDAALEKWLPTLGDVPKDKTPSANEFQAKLNTAVDTLKQTYADIVIDPGPTKTPYVQLEPVADGTQKKIQKQYWIMERVLIALKKAGSATVNDPTPIRLLSTIDFGQSGFTPSYSPGDKDKQKPLMAPIPVKITASMSMRDISKACRELLSQDIVFRLRSLHTELLPFSISKPDLQLVVNTDPKPLYESPIYSATLGDPAKRPPDEEAVFPEPKLKVTIELDAMDFDMDAINAVMAQPGGDQPAKGGK